MANRYNYQDYGRDDSRGERSNYRNDRENYDSNYDRGNYGMNYGGDNRDRDDNYNRENYSTDYGRNYGRGSSSYRGFEDDHGYYGRAGSGSSGSDRRAANRDSRNYYGGTETGRGDYERERNFVASDEGDYRYGKGSINIRSGSTFERGFDRNRGGQSQDERGFLDKTYDEMASWFGDEEAERRRQRDQSRQEMRGSGGHRGKGPKGYQPSDDRIKDNISDLLWDDDQVDASDVEVQVQSGEVTLTGTVRNRFEKRRIEDIAEDARGVQHVQNNIRVKKQENETSLTNQNNNQMTTGTTAATTATGSGRAKSAAS